MAVDRRLPRVGDLAPLMQFKRPQFNRTKRRLETALTIEDLRRVAKRRTPRAAFDYTDGAAEDELSIERARQAFRDIEFHPTILRDVTSVRTGWDVFGKPVALPFGIAPTGFTRLMHTEGEIAGARAAAEAGIPFSMSTLATCAIEDLQAAVPQGRKWFQLYMWRDRDRSMALVKRAADAGFDTMLVTVDVPVAGARLRDVRNGMSIPPALTLRTVLDALPHPHWWFDLLTTEPLAFASLDRWSGTVGEYLNTMFDPSVTFDDLEWMKPNGQASWSSRGSRPSTMPARWWNAGPTASCCPIMAVANSIVRRRRSTCCPWLPASWARTPRSWWTPASCPVPISSPRSRSVRGAR